jgi:hypothetical protein
MQLKLSQLKSLSKTYLAPIIPVIKAKAVWTEGLDPELSINPKRPLRLNQGDYPRPLYPEDSLADLVYDLILDKNGYEGVSSYLEALRKSEKELAQMVLAMLE